jgi:Skp family chaperone for outer membrane proteins
MSPVLEAFAKEKGLQIVLDQRNVTWAGAGMDISAEIVKRMDAVIKK